MAKKKIKQEKANKYAKDSSDEIWNYSVSRKLLNKWQALQAVPGQKDISMSVFVILNVDSVKLAKFCWSKAFLRLSLFQLRADPWWPHYSQPFGFGTKVRLFVVSGVEGV